MSKNQIETQRVSIIITKKCTLKCKLCGALAPYIENYNPSVSFLKKEIDAFFQIVDLTGIIDISGGEPMIRTNAIDFALGDILYYLVEQYGNRFKKLRIFTNGTIIPNAEICKVFHEISLKKPFSITIDNYGVHSPHVEAIAEQLYTYHVEYDIRDYSKDIHCGGWVDLRDISLKYPAPQDAKELFSKCAIPQKLGCCLELMDGVLSPCSVAAARYLCGESDKNSADILDLFADPEQMRKKLQQILTADYFPSCHYCIGGLSDESKRVIPAEQATDKEITAWKQTYNMRL